MLSFIRVALVMVSVQQDNSSLDSLRGPLHNCCFRHYQITAAALKDPASIYKARVKKSAL